MSEPAPILANLRRPRLLVRAARAGTRAYCRETHLARLAAAADPARDPGGIVGFLRGLEARWEDRRRANAADYSPAAHVAVLVALLAEMAEAARLAA